MCNVIPSALVNVRRDNHSNRQLAVPRDRSRPASRIASQTLPTRTRSRAWRSSENRRNPERAFNNGDLDKYIYISRKVDSSFYFPVKKYRA